MYNKLLLISLLLAALSPAKAQSLEAEISRKTIEWNLFEAAFVKEAMLQPNAPGRNEAENAVFAIFRALSDSVVVNRHFRNKPKRYKYNGQKIVEQRGFERSNGYLIVQDSIAYVLLPADSTLTKLAATVRKNERREIHPGKKYREPYPDFDLLVQNRNPLYLPCHSIVPFRPEVAYHKDSVLYPTTEMVRRLEQYASKYAKSCDSIDGITFEDYFRLCGNFLLFHLTDYTGMNNRRLERSIYISLIVFEAGFQRAFVHIDTGTSIWTVTLSHRKNGWVLDQAFQAGHYFH